jgi:inhibitor of cysteine peptidase
LKYQEEEVMKFLKVTLIVLFIAVLLTGCAPAPTPPAPTPTPTPTPSPSTFSNSGQPITVPVGVSFTISVSSNPSTGYSWEAGFDQSVLKLIKRYTPSSSGLIGAGGTENFEFEGMKPGETKIYLNYKRSFEPNNPSLKSEIFNVTITR